MNLKNRIRELRLEKGLTQGQVAEALKCDRSNISYYESGRSLSIISLIKLSRLFGVSTDYILCLTDKRKADDKSE